MSLGDPSNHNFLPSSLSRNSLFSVGQSLLGIVAIFLSFRLLVKHHGIEALGLWSISVGLVSFARLADFSGGSALARFVAIAEDGLKAKYIDTILIFNLLFYSILCAAIWFPISLLLGVIVDPEVTPISQRFILYAILSLLLMVVSSSQLNALDGLHRADIRATIYSLGLLLFLLLAVLWVPSQSVIGLAKAQIIQFFFQLILARYLLRNKVDGISIIPKQWSTSAFKETFTYGIKLQLNSISVLIFEPSTKIIITYFSGLEVLGVYELAYKLTTYLRSVILAALTPVIPVFSKAHKDSPKNSIEKLVQIQNHLNKFTVGFVLLSLLAAPVVSWIVLSEISTFFLTMVYALIVAYSINIFGTPIYLYAQAVGVLRWNIIGHFIITVSSVLFCLIFSQAFPAKNTALGVAFGLALGSLVLLIKNAQMFGLSAWTLRPNNKLTLGTILTFATFSIGYFVLAQKMQIAV